MPDRLTPAGEPGGHAAPERPAEGRSPTPISSFSRQIDWKDPSVPAGNAPAMARWPLALAVAAWVAWIVFLAVLALTRQVLPSV